MTPSPVAPQGAHPLGQGSQADGAQVVSSANAKPTGQQKEPPTSERECVERILYPLIYLDSARLIEYAIWKRATDGSDNQLVQVADASPPVGGEGIREALEEAVAVLEITVEPSPIQVALAGNPIVIDRFQDRMHDALVMARLALGDSSKGGE